MELKVEEVGLSYGARPVLQNVSFTLEQQESALLLGPSGSGKSSLLNIICGLQTPDRGTVTLGTERVVSADGSANSDAVRRRSMGIIFQTLRLVSALSLKANLLLAQKIQNGAHDPNLVQETLDRLGIADRANARPFELSQGEAQRAAIARALVVKPTLLIADEPTSALDAANAERAAQLLLDVARNAGASLLVATHDQRLNALFARTMTLDNGRLAA
ncbi:MAG: ATP-binding cassette domain-containing protein [Erythrobacter sp.]|uniref:ABC transporter ATP-binding protein n=1 Tax=Erythrobacter sp. TaxID=1042 RepID=UPI0026296F82|nr:ATP-binding cassette domain-containing protein [Erythrobacter sp.]MDJ0977734.1 ATP-binding cassette domain-containing protein [Erythrobacter sp.]